MKKYILMISLVAMSQTSLANVGGSRADCVTKFGSDAFGKRTMKALGLTVDVLVPASSAEAKALIAKYPKEKLDAIYQINKKSVEIWNPELAKKICGYKF